MLNKNLKLLLRILFSLILIGWFIKAIDWSQIIVMLVGIKLKWLVVAIVWIVLAMVVSTVKWQVITKAQGLKVSFSELWRAYWVGIFFNNFLPSSIGGDALRILWVAKLSGDSPGATSSVVIERILATTGLAVLGLFGCMLVDNPDQRLITLFCFLIILTLALLALIMSGRVPKFILVSQNKVFVFLVGMIRHGLRVKEHPLSIFKAFVWSVIFQICIVGTNHALFQGLSLNMVDVFKSIYVIPATSVASMLPLGINGYGLREGAYVMLLTPFGVPKAGAFSSSVLFAFLVSICSLWGGWIWLFWRKKAAFQIQKEKKCLLKKSALMRGEFNTNEINNKQSS
ncbi:lysylphosphatidylglycerol synthase transmembrane domain-containing protein [Desulfosporosinus sp. Sb-LF]|uniref:lysylphosphatidylglycerol synthase transmembrane domain-containing protein n=1 Tax=Desulfosporosinus sp. Sb-LF TaxID=2560027 RepID=UPI00107FC9B6|nr:lysylphosphatidylglycerol synthase transmembrane domain-containing protein [Desulfosporosinus sp. Sb-LF]TGE34588.1 flippase-like domain-containing protein [Desulfosporosinus sp. Sb-LF]